MMNRHLQTYKNNEVNTASKVKLVVMMYDGAIRFLKECLKKIEENDIAGRGLYLMKVQKIIGELHESINKTRGGEIAGNLENAYNLITTKLTHANINGDIEQIEQSITILEGVRDAWKEISQDVATDQGNNNASSRVALNL